ASQRQVMNSETFIMQAPLSQTAVHVIFLQRMLGRRSHEGQRLVGSRPPSEINRMRSPLTPGGSLGSEIRMPPGLLRSAPGYDGPDVSVLSPVLSYCVLGFPHGQNRGHRHKKAINRQETKREHDRLPIHMLFP